MHLSVLEYYDYKTGTWKRGNLKDCFVLAIVDKGYSMEFKGLNICIVIEKPINSTNTEPYDMKESLDEHFKKLTSPFTTYLIGENGVKIPLLIHGGNGWDGNCGYERETCCYFGSIHPLMFGSTEKGRAYAT